MFSHVSHYHQQGSSAAGHTAATISGDWWFVSPALHTNTVSKITENAFTSNYPKWLAEGQADLIPSGLFERSHRGQLGVHVRTRRHSHPTCRLVQLTLADFPRSRTTSRPQPLCMTPHLRLHRASTCAEWHCKCGAPIVVARSHCVREAGSFIKYLAEIF